jgi:hypothetical protein
MEMVSEKPDCSDDELMDIAALRKKAASSQKGRLDRRREHGLRVRRHLS